MKALVNIIIFSSIALVMASCSKDYLDREPSDYLTGEQIKEYTDLNPEIAKGMIRGIYSNTFAWGTGGTSNHDDFGQKSIDIVMDLMSGDMVLTGKNYGWFSLDYELNAMSKTNARAYQIWRYYYKIIKGANEVIDGLKADSIDAVNRPAYGQALTLRAYAYYYLVNLYQHPYSDNPNALGVPVYKTQLVADAAPLSTVDSIYQFIISDLELAIDMLEGFQRDELNEIDQSVAKGFLAYAKLATQSFDEAVLLATELISSGVYPLMDKDEVIQSGFNSANIPGWMWGVNINKDNSTGLASFWGMMDVFTYSYAGAGDGKAIDLALFDTIPDNDVRKQQFLNNPDDQYYLHPTYKFYDAGRQIFGDQTWTNDIVYMRIAEMYLIAAEAYAQTSQVDAKKVLGMLLTEREPGATARINALSDEELMNEIHLQWRIEFWGEGKSLFALKRMQKTAYRGDNHRTLANTWYEYNSKEMIFEIPENETLNNPQIDGNSTETDKAATLTTK